ncbi:MAG: tetratricopeptide repeat protein [Candidatus Omnitrophica bacterium]|nr:tetratricopeptide repeat protein [Candidatus Omnitrophota bacterium]
MKKFSTSFVILLAFLTAGCSKSYLSERAFYQADQVLKRITADQIQRDSKSAFTPAIQAFQKVADEFPGTQKAGESLFVISDLYTRQKNYGKARETLGKIVQNFSGWNEWTSDARYRIAQLYEAEGNWETAEAKYWETAEYNPLERRGLQAPLYVILHYKQAKDTANQELAYQKAVEHCKKMLTQVGPIQVSSSLKNSLALVHFSHGKLKEARTEWLSIVEQFPDSPYASLALLTVAELSWKEKQFEQAFRDFDEFFKRYSKHSLAGRTAIRVGLLHANQKEFAQAREWYEKALNEYFKKGTNDQADLKILIAKTYQDEEKWEEAERYYQELETQYALTPAALQVPFMRYLHYKKVDETEKANQVLDEAVERYQKVVSEHPNSKIAAYAKRFIIQAFTQKKDWDQLLTTVDQELQNETIEDRKGRWLFLKALIAENRLKDRERALSYYQDFLAQFPDHPLAQLAKSHQEVLSKPQIAPVS